MRSAALFIALCLGLWLSPAVAAWNPTPIPAPRTVQQVQRFFVSPIIPSIAVSRQTCVAPCHVFVDATGTTDISVTSNPFLDLDYAGNCGGVTGTWAYGSNNSRNLFYGAIGECVYETAGTYQISMTVTDTIGPITVAPASALITVTTGWATTNTICVGAASLPVQGVDGCPASALAYNMAAHGTTNLDQVLTDNLATGKRLLFKHGDAFPTPCTATIPTSFAGPASLDSYGAGLATFSASGSCASGAILQIATGAVDLRVRSINFDCTTFTPCGVITFQSPNNGADEILFDGLTANGTTSAGISSGPATPSLPINHIALVNSSITNLTTVSGCQSMWFTNGIKNSAIIGNNFDRSDQCPPPATAPGYNVRWQSWKNMVFTNNNDQHPPAGKAAFNAHGPTPGAEADLNPSQYYIIRDNVFGVQDADATHGSAGVVVDPQNSTSGENIANVVLDSNVYISGSLNTSLLVIEAVNVTSRNEIFDLAAKNNLLCQPIKLQWSSAGATPPDNIPTNISVLNDTAYGPNCPNSGSALVQVVAAIGTVTVKNGLAYFPMSANSGLGIYNINGCPAGCATFPTPTLGGNSTSVQMSSGTPTNPFAMTPNPVTPSTFAPTGYALPAIPPAGQSVVVPNYYDFFRTPFSGSYSVGAIK